MTAAGPACSAPAAARPAGTLRLFLALWPDGATSKALAAWRDAFRWPAGAAPVPDERLHLTLHFIGNVPATRLPALAAGLRVAVRPFELDLDQAEVWPRGLAVLGCRQPPDALAALHAALGAALRQLDLPVERRPFRPHVTLARKAAGALPPAGRDALRWSVDGYCLMQSAQGYRRLVGYGTPPDAPPRPAAERSVSRSEVCGKR